MLWKKMKGVQIPEEKQGLIRFVCLNYKDMPEETRERIDGLIDRVGGENKDALRQVMCSRHGIRYISSTYYISESSLYRMRKRFYEEW